MRRLSITTREMKIPQDIEEGAKIATSSMKGLSVECLPSIACRMRRLRFLKISPVASSTSKLDDGGAFFGSLDKILFRNCFPNYRFPEFNIQQAGEFVGGLLPEDTFIHCTSGHDYDEHNGNARTPYSEDLKSKLSEFAQVVEDSL